LYPIKSVIYKSITCSFCHIFRIIAMLLCFSLYREASTWVYAFICGLIVAGLLLSWPEQNRTEERLVLWGPAKWPPSTAPSPSSLARALLFFFSFYLF